MKIIIIIATLLLFFEMIFGQDVIEQEDDSLRIEDLLNYFIHEVSCDRSGPDLFRNTITENYVFLGGELPGTTFYIVDDYNIEKIRITGDSAICEVKLYIDKILTINSLYNSTDIILLFKLKKSSDGDWKIDDQLNRGINSPSGYRQIALFDQAEIIYMPFMYDYFLDFKLNPKSYKYEYLLYMRKTIHSYYHNQYQFKESGLEKYSVNELKTIRNSIIAHYGRKFKTKWLQSYFNKKQWYSENPEYSDSLLTENDLKNIKTIRNIEKILYTN